MATCVYCNCNLFNSERYVIRQAIKPRGQPHRWKNIGSCCDQCHESYDKEISFEYLEPLPKEYLCLIQS